MLKKLKIFTEFQMTKVGWQREALHEFPDTCPTDVFSIKPNWIP